MADDAAEGLLNPVAHRSPEAPLLMSQQALGLPAPFVAVLTHCVMVRPEAGDEVFQVFELGLHGGEPCEQRNLRLRAERWRRVRHPDMNDAQRLSNC